MPPFYCHHASEATSGRERLPWSEPAGKLCPATVETSDVAHQETSVRVSRGRHTALKEVLDRRRYSRISPSGISNGFHPEAATAFMSEEMLVVTSFRLPLSSTYSPTMRG